MPKKRYLLQVRYYWLPASDFDAVGAAHSRITQLYLWPGHAPVEESLYSDGTIVIKRRKTMPKERIVVHVMKGEGLHQ